MTNSRTPLIQLINEAVRRQHQTVADLASTLQYQALETNNALESLRKRAQAANHLQDLMQQLLKVHNQHFLDAPKFARRALDINFQVVEQFRGWVQQWEQDQPRRDEEEYKALEKFAHMGWYPDPHMPWNAPLKLVETLNEGCKEDVVEAIGKYFRRRIDAIETEVGVSYPNRKLILHDAFQAHRDGLYNLSIPVLLIQADGMWWDKFTTSLFIEGDRKNTVKDQLSKFQYHFYARLSELFKAPIPLWISRSGRDPSFNELNRHKILHGETVDYGTEQNSLKTISLISWLNWILNQKNNMEN